MFIAFPVRPVLLNSTAGHVKRDSISRMDKKQSSTPKALLYLTDLRIKEVKPANGLYFTLDELQGYVGGRIEILHLEADELEDRLLVVHEEGKLISLPFNLPATLIWIMYYGETDFVSGDAVICDPIFIR